MFEIFCVYFDQGMVDLHAASWSKSSFHQFNIFFFYNLKKVQKGEKYKKNGVYQRLGAAIKMQRK